MPVNRRALRPGFFATLLLLAAALPCGGRSSVSAESPAPDRVYLAAGWFTMGASNDDVTYARRLCVSERATTGVGLRGCGSEELFASETPSRRVYLGAFALDRHEVSRAEHEACIDSGVCEVPELDIQHPGLVGPEQPASAMRWTAARALCRQRGGRLPTEAEWERAARGDSARRFPWGSAYNPRLANHGEPNLSFDPSGGRPSSGDGYAFAADVGAFAASASPDGLVQMAGNVWEWTADAFAPLSAQGARVDPLQTVGGGQRVVRGGSFRTPAFTLRVSHREGREQERGHSDVGVRCAYDVHARHSR